METIFTIEKLDLTILPQLPYSPDLADFHLFPKMKEGLCGHLYDSDEEMGRTVRTWKNFVTALRNC
jgi:hypothetical protein